MEVEESSLAPWNDSVDLGTDRPTAGNAPRNGSGAGEYVSASFQNSASHFNGYGRAAPNHSNTLADYSKGAPELDLSRRKGWERTEADPLRGATRASRLIGWITAPSAKPPERI